MSLRYEEALEQGVSIIVNDILREFAMETHYCSTCEMCGKEFDPQVRTGPCCSEGCQLTYEDRMAEARELLAMNIEQIRDWEENNEPC